MQRDFEMESFLNDLTPAVLKQMTPHNKLNKART